MHDNPVNEAFQPHGYWVFRYPNKCVWYRGEFKNGEKCGLWEWYNRYGNLECIGEYKRNKKCGYWRWYSKDKSIIMSIFYAN